MVGVMAAPEKWMYEAAACLALLVPPILWLAHKTSARTIEDCYGSADSGDLLEWNES